jgi:small nuclear ribonucleoprotein D2
MSAAPTKTARTEAGGDVAAATKKAKKTLAELEKEEEDAFKTGPFRVLYDAVHSPGTSVLVSCRNDKKLVGKLRAFDRHFNMVLEGVNEVWVERSHKKGADAEGESKMRFIPKMFLRGDTVILVTTVDQQ